MKLDAARCISRGTSHGMDIFHRAIRHQQSILMVVVISPSMDARSMVSCTAARSSGWARWTINSTGRFRRPVTSKDPESLVRPDDLSAGDVPSKASGAAQSLRFSQIHFAVQERGFNPLLILPSPACRSSLRTPESSAVAFLCAEIRNGNNERRNGKQDQTRHLRNIHSG